MMEITTQEVEFTAEGTLLEVLRVVDVKDSIAPVRLRVREWIDERHYRDVDVSEDPSGSRTRVDGRVSASEEYFVSLVGPSGNEKGEREVIVDG